MKDLAQLALDTAKARGAGYADIRIIEARREDINVKNGAIGSIDESETIGFGVRVIANGSWGFSSSSQMTREEIERVATEAVAIAKASSTLQEEVVRLTPEPTVRERWVTPIMVDPFNVSVAEKLDLLYAVDEVLRKDEKIKVAMGYMSFFREKQLLATTEGAEIDQTLIRSGAGYSATAVDKGEMQRRSYPASFGGQYMSIGYELVRGMPLLENAERVRDEAVALLSAPPLPSGKRDVILESSQLALQIHESVGHPVELDRVLGSEANFAGRSFVTVDKLKDRFKYGSDIVNIVSDCTMPGGLATFGYDDDGVRAQRFHIIQDGIFSGYLTNRELAHVPGNERSHGCNRADGFNRLPMIRQTNICLLPGTWNYDDLLSDTDGGILFETNKSWSIDQLRLNFQFGCEAAWEIKGGKKATLYKNPNYQGITPEFWNSCDAICGDDAWQLWGIPNCGKGQPGQTAEVSHGCSPTRFRGVEVGIGNT
ncbi:TldD/PmbA family protein [Candidatus Eisenbacteria bacterium]|uniref:TldD/PmbA family protein n=1 Tax=Eiseniibacteriota bacterium TaxID=2212470 RepID=A0ABV6YJM8_UNCEI